MARTPQRTLLARLRRGLIFGILCQWIGWRCCGADVSLTAPSSQQGWTGCQADGSSFPGSIREIAIEPPAEAHQYCEEVAPKDPEEGAVACYSRSPTPIFPGPDQGPCEEREGSSPTRVRRARVRDQEPPGRRGNGWNNDNLPLVETTAKHRPEDPAIVEGFQPLDDEVRGVGMSR